MTSTGARPTTPTLDEVAVLAGVSRATVSRVINDSPRVSPSARDAVQAAVAQLRYVPNRMARSLVTRRTDTIALVLSETNTQIFSDPFFARIVRGVTAALADTDLTVVLLAARDGREQEKAGRYVRQGHVDGVILMSMHHDDVLPAVLADASVPLVLFGRPLDGGTFSYVDADNTGGAAMAARHLVEQGRRRIGTVTGPQDMNAGIDRFAGFRTALADAGLPLPAERCAKGDFTEAGGARATARLLEQAPDLDAVFVASDPMAVGALRVLAESGRRVPDDVAVVGFDDAPVAAESDPPLTTVAQPLTEMTQELTDLLRRQIEGSREVETRICDTHLVRRASA
ncbi:LacI family DNA-binding transcriptional regulator [Blastococcus xanthinilyticus]|uniref:LacI family transcriptional regulator n=1 Tax=Blastococcus xanthinilyticus TaxID=1564164 RepID=A0A5S5CZU3_9ACTN|nr:LacI family DNA-binding transcriptional regulator [Blastococcus xanthinilyticus]TYP88528.1 LacI family transcriptional regulator [Blastococcus xanthinilyticus]